DEGKKKKKAEPKVNDLLVAKLTGKPTGGDVPEPKADEMEAIAWRVILPMANEAARLLEEGVIDSTDAIDLATVLGTGLAPFRGGLAHFVDATGVEFIVQRLEQFQTKHGARFAPAP